MKLYAAPNTRAVRVVWLLEELGLDYELALVEFKPTQSEFFVQATPTGKIPTLEDDGTLLVESGAIIEYVQERYGEGRLAPAIGDSQRGEYLQWLHFAEATAFPPLGILVWLTRYRQDGGEHGALIADARQRVATTLEFVEKHMSSRQYLLGEEFSAADIMMGFTLLAAQMLDQLAPQPSLSAYTERLLARPALQTALTKLGG